VEQIYRIRMPEGNEPFSTILDELREAFVTVREPCIDWIHPSYRDLVIEELAADKTLRQKVLTSITLSGLTVAVSDTSGAHGERKYPLIASTMDWNLLGEGCVKLVFSSSSAIATDALRVLASAAESATEPDVADELSRILYKACEAIRERWDANGIVFTADQLRTFCQTSLLASPLPVLPRFEHTWAALEKDLITSLSLWEVDNRVDSDIVQEWAELAQIVAHNEPRFMLKKRFPANYRDAANRIAVIIDSELDRTEEFDCADDYVLEANRCDRLVKAVESMHKLDLIDSNIASSLQERLEARSFEYGERASEMGPPEHDYDDYRSEREESINLNELFRDL
jgi:hypothetical protein